MGSTRLRRAFGDLDITKQDRAKLIPAVLGFLLNGVQTVDVPNRPGYVYARIRSNLNEMVQVFNDKVSPVYDLPVLLVRDPNNPIRYKVDGRDVGRYENWGSSSSYLPKHGNQHSFNPSGGGGGDITWVYSQQITPWLVSPSGTAGSGGVLIHGYADYVDSSWHYFGGTGTSDILAYKPTGTFARMVLVYLDGNGNPQLSPGSTQFDTTSTGTNTILSYLPGVPSADDTPLAGILLVSGTSSILWGNIFDVRPFFGASTASPVVALDDLSDVVITTPTSGQYLRHNGSNWVNQTGSSTVSSLDDLSDVTISALVSGSYLYYNGLQWINTIQPRFREGIVLGHYPDDYLQTNGYGEIGLFGQALRWEKESLPFTAGHVGSSAPTWATITGSFAGYQFAANNNMIFAVDMPLNWLTFDNAKVYISWETSSPETANKWVKWQVEYKAANQRTRQRYGAVASGTLAAETMIPSGTATNVAMFTEVGELSLGNDSNIGTNLQFVVTRLASSSGTAPVTDPFGIIFGIEYRLDSMGAFSTTQKTVSG